MWSGLTCAGVALRMSWRPESRRGRSARRWCFCPSRWSWDCSSAPPHPGCRSTSWSRGVSKSQACLLFTSLSFLDWRNHTLLGGSGWWARASCHIRSGYRAFFVQVLHHFRAEFHVWRQKFLDFKVIFFASAKKKKENSVLGLSSLKIRNRVFDFCTKKMSFIMHTETTIWPQ